MSFLKERIDPILKAARKCGDVPGAIRSFKSGLERTLKTLRDDKNLRVSDKARGGVLRGPIKSRAEKEDKKSLLCNKKYLTRGRGGTPTEVPYMRALFNARKLSQFALVAYETPLMRLNRGRHRRLSCDLLGLAGKELCCIEVKVVPDANATIPPYALLESFAYSVCLNWLLRECGDLLFEELELCCFSFGYPRPPALPEKATFAVAAPQADYFEPFACKRLLGHGPEWFRRRKSETAVIEQAILSSWESWFSGYMAIPAGRKEIEEGPSKVELVRPVLSAGAGRVITAKCFNGLLAKISQ